MRRRRRRRWRRAIATISQGLVARPIMPWAPVMPVSALMDVSETPKRSPAAAASMTPWCSAAPPMRGPMISRPPTPNRPASKAIITTGEKCECAPCMAGRVTPSRTRPIAVRMSPTHCRGPTEKPNMPVRHHRDEDDAGGERDLDHRHRRERQGRDVQPPASRSR